MLFAQTKRPQKQHRWSVRRVRQRLHGYLCLLLLAPSKLVGGWYLCMRAQSSKSGVAEAAGREPLQAQNREPKRSASRLRCMFEVDRVWSCGKRTPGWELRTTPGWESHFVVGRGAAVQIATKVLATRESCGERGWELRTTPGWE